MPFRVVGFIESTQATAGTWATAPSTLQGYGGQALAAMSSLGYGQTWQSVTRTSGVTYYNLTGKPILLQLMTVQGNSSVTLTVNGVSVGSSLLPTAAGQVPWATIIPVSASYVVTDGGTNTHTTFELR